MTAATNARQPNQPIQPAGPRLGRRRGVALILAIAFIVLLTGLIVGFFSRVTTELGSGASYSEGVSGRQLADTAVNVVMGQIRTATSVPNGCWASQPGMIRVYAASSGTAGSAPYKFYKLYSSHDLIVSSGEFANFNPIYTSTTVTSFTGTAVPANYQPGGTAEVPLKRATGGGWNDQPAYFCDLNAPVTIQALDPVTGLPVTRQRWPIFDPNVAKIPNLPGVAGGKPYVIEGCEINLPASELPQSGNSSTAVSSTSPVNAAPMPVRWIYVLKDGSLTAPTPLAGAATTSPPYTGAVATFPLSYNEGASGSAASKTRVPTIDNPIVGRIAFWTDDETCKVNVNTAGGPLYNANMSTDDNTAAWDLPAGSLGPPYGYTRSKLYPCTVASGVYSPGIEDSPAHKATCFWDTPRVLTLFDRGRNSPQGQSFFPLLTMPGVIDPLSGITDVTSTTQALFEGGLANGQPVAHEYQRYPGHPAQTSLALVFKNIPFLPNPDGNILFNSQKFYSVLPRLQAGGSNDGSEFVDKHIISFSSSDSITSTITLDGNGNPTVVTLSGTSDQGLSAGALWGQLLPGVTRVSGPNIDSGSAVNNQAGSPNYVLTQAAQDTGTVKLNYNVLLKPAPYNYGVVAWKTTYPPTPTTVDNYADPQSYHLYASLDELVFTTRNEAVTDAGGALKRNLADTVQGLGSEIAGGGNPIITPTRADQLRFVLTAHNRAPELNLYGRPRISCWPVETKAQRNVLANAPVSTPNVFDDLIRFCSTVGANNTTWYADANNDRPGQFIFERQDPYHVQSDLYTAADTLPRNKNLFNYLVGGYAGVTGVTQQTVPGWDASFQTKYGTKGIAQIMCEIFDYIRVVNLKDTSRDKPINALTTLPAAPFNTKPALRRQARYAPRGWVVPTRTVWPPGSINQISGFGRFTSVSEVALVFYHGGYVWMEFDQSTGQPCYRDVIYDDVTATLPTPVTPNVTTLPVGHLLGDPANPSTAAVMTDAYGSAYRKLTHRLIRAFLLTSMYNPMQGYAPTSGFDSTAYPAGNGPASAPYGPQEMLQFKIDNMQGFKISSPSDPADRQLEFPPQPLYNYVKWSSGDAWAGRNFGGIEGFLHTILGKTRIVPILSNGTPTNSISGDYQSDPNVDQAFYQFQTLCRDKFDGAMVPIQDTGFNFKGGSFDLTLTYLDKAHDNLPAHTSQIQKIHCNFPASTNPWPVPITPRDPATKTTAVHMRGLAWYQDRGGFDPFNGMLTVVTTTTAMNYTPATYVPGTGLASTIHKSQVTTDINQPWRTWLVTRPSPAGSPNSAWPRTSRSGAGGLGFPVGPGGLGIGLTWTSPTPSTAGPYNGHNVWRVPPNAPCNLAGGVVKYFNACERFMRPNSIGFWIGDGANAHHNNNDPNHAAGGETRVPHGLSSYEIYIGGNYSGYTLTPAPNATTNSWTYRNTNAAIGPVGTNVSDAGWAMVCHFGSRLAWAQQHGFAYWSDRYYYWTPQPNSVRITVFTGGDTLNYGNRNRQIFQPGDTIRSIVLGSATNNNGGIPPNTSAADPRVTAVAPEVWSYGWTGTPGIPGTGPNFYPHPQYFDNALSPSPITERRRACTLRMGNGAFYFDPIYNGGNTVAAGLNLGLNPGEATALSGGPWNDARPTGTLAPLSGNFAANPVKYSNNTGPYIARGIFAGRDGAPGYADFDTGMGNCTDGAFCNKPDEGNLVRNWHDGWGTYHWVEPYYNTWYYDPPTESYFTPNRQIPSPVMFGSLIAPKDSGSGLEWDKAGWRTLLFCPNYPGADAGLTHYGTGKDSAGNQFTVPDHLLLDLFWMPVVEPYAISEPFSTDGKVNLNYQIVPFGYIKRTTALRAVLQPMRVTAIPQHWTNASNILAYKVATSNNMNPENLRYLVNRDETLRGFDDFFAQYDPSTVSGRGKGFFKSASQVCERFLFPLGRVFVPQNPTIRNTGAGPAYVSGMCSNSGAAPTAATANTNIVAMTHKAGDVNETDPLAGLLNKFWKYNALTGDNVREKPYCDMYPRITTKSNTFTIHYLVQTVRQRPYPGLKTDPACATWYGTWDEARDQVVSEARGSTTIERYIDPLDTRLTTPAPSPLPAGWLDVDKDSLETAYRFRVISNKKFQPW